MRQAIELNDAIDDVGIGTELTLPQGVADHGHLVLAELILAGQERPAERGLDAEDVEVAGGYTCTAQLNRLGPAGHRHVAAGLRGMGVEDRVVSLPVQEIQRRDAVPFTLRRLLEDPDDPFGLIVGQRFQQDAVHEAENRHIGADANGQRQDRHQRKTPAVGQRACGVAQILAEGRHRASW